MMGAAPPGRDSMAFRMVPAVRYIPDVGDKSAL
jgi:hypothetical protein